MKSNAILAYSSPNMGGINISWESIMKLYTYERDALAIALKELREDEAARIKEHIKT
jgi:hypothetical protein